MSDAATVSAVMRSLSARRWRGQVPTRLARELVPRVDELPEIERRQVEAGACAAGCGGAIWVGRRAPFPVGWRFWEPPDVHGLPGDGLALTFHFPAGVGDGVYAKLIGRPGLAAIVTLDRELCRVLSVQFVNRP
jgi:hypothetical protein